jgi:hypothetical protein
MEGRVDLKLLDFYDFIQPLNAEETNYLPRQITEPYSLLHRADGVVAGSLATRRPQLALRDLMLSAT